VCADETRVADLDPSTKIRIIFGNWIRICIRVKSWIRIRIIVRSRIRIHIKGKIQQLQMVKIEGRYPLKSDI
jgi:hypothetical protein